MLASPIIGNEFDEMFEPIYHQLPFSFVPVRRIAILVRKIDSVFRYPALFHGKFKASKALTTVVDPGASYKSLEGRVMPLIALISQLWNDGIHRSDAITGKVAAR